MMLSFDDACEALAYVARPLGTEFVGLDAACGRVLAADLVARRTAPEAATSAMDGYAVRDCDVAAGPARLRIVGESFAGPKAFGRPLDPGDCVRIFTGARLPPGADRVVIQESVERDGNAVLVAEAPAARHVRAAGSDFSRGEILLDAGCLITPNALVTAAAADYETLEVYRRPRVRILSTGDELAEPGFASNTPGRIPESISFGVAALTRAWGGEVVGRQRLGDDLSVLRPAAGLALNDCHIVVVTGGASVGERDHARAMFAPFGLTPIFTKVAMKPGKPIWIGAVGERIVLGLPGNPSAAMVTARLFLAPLLAGMTGRPAREALCWRAAPLAAPLASCSDRESFHRARSDPDGVRPIRNQDSSAQKDLAVADLLIRRRAGARPLERGDVVEVLAF